MILNDPRWPVTFYVYAYASPDGEIVYVGQTADPITRRCMHRAQWWWSADLEWAIIATADTRSESRALEADAIREYRPVGNYQHNPARKARAAA